MKAYIMGNYTEKAFQGFMKDPTSDRKAVVEQLTKAVGGTIHSMDIVRGSYDFIVVTEVGSVRDPEVIQSIPQGIFDRAAIRAALRYKYKPLIRDGNAVEVEGVTQRITFVLEGDGKGPGYVPENCKGVGG